MRRSAPHPYVETLKGLLAAGKIGRRQFLRSATLLGLSAAVAYGVVGRLGKGTQLQAARAPLPMGGALRIAMPVPDLSQPRRYAWIEPEIARQVVPTLTRDGPDGVTRPHLLDSWDVSADLRSWTLHLRRDVRWRKGGRLTADQVAWNLRGALDETAGSPALSLMGPYMLGAADSGGVDGAGGSRRALWDADAIEVLDPYTLRLNTRVPQVALPQHLQHGALCMLDPAEDGIFGPGSNGTGGFELVEIAPGERALLKKAASHWGEHGPFLDTVEFVDFGEDPGAAIAALAEGKVAGLYRVELAQLDAVKQMAHAQLYEAPSATTSVARMKVSEPPFSDPRVRKAMRLAIDCQAVLEAAVGEHGLPGEHHHVCSIQQDYAKLHGMTRDLEAARALLAAAGFPDGFKCEILVKDEPGWQLAAVEAMRAQWAEAGVKVRIRKAPWSLYWELWNKVPFGFTDWAHEQLGSTSLALAYRSGARWNESGYANPEFDRLLDKVEATLDLPARRAVMAELEKLMQEDGPIVQPLWISTFAAYDRRVQGFVLYSNRNLFADELALGG